MTRAPPSLAGLMALIIVLLARVRRLRRAQWPTLFLVALGVIVGFPLCTALALRSITAAHSLVFIGLLPMATALFGAWLGGEHPSRRFWLFAALGAASVVGQLQLLQPFMGLMLAAWLLRESVTLVRLAVTAFVVACVAGARYAASAPYA